MQNFCFPTFFICDTASRRSPFVQTALIKCKIENGKWKIAVGQTVCKRKNTTYAVKNTA